MVELTDSTLYLDGVSVSFDGFKALNELSLILAKGEMRAIIGPNGAGKTTMMDVITGKTRPDKGEIFFEGSIDLTKHDEAAIAELGIGRKFQKPTVFETQTVYDNLELALKADRSVFATLFWRSNPKAEVRIDEILGITRLGDHADELAGSLSHGQKQWLEIGMLLIQGPELLMLDEPVAGMSVKEREQTANLLQDICADRSVIVIEHDMEFVERIAERVTVMHQGQVLADGPLSEIKKNEKVIEVYLGH